MEKSEFVKKFCKADQNTMELIAFLLSIDQNEAERVKPILRTWLETEEKKPEELRRLLGGAI